MNNAFDFTVFHRAITGAKFDTPRLQAAQAVFVAMPEEAQRNVVKTCAHLDGIRGAGAVTAFEIFVAVAQVAGR